MIGSLVNRASNAPFLMSLMMMGLSAVTLQSTALAQDAGPKRLIPNAPRPAVAAPGVPSTTSTSAPYTPASRSGGGRGEVPYGITAVPLPKIDAESSGLLDSQAGGLGADIWRGSSRAQIEDWLRRLPAENSSPALRDLMRRLLLTAASAPAREVASRTTLDTSTVGLLGLRGERLLAMGDGEAVEALAKAAGENAEDVLLSEVHVDALLLSGDNTAACRQARDDIQRTPSRNLQKVLIFCQALEGEKEKAQLGIELLQEQTEAMSDAERSSDVRFFDMFDAMSSRRSAPSQNSGAFDNLSPLRIAMMRQAGWRLPQSVLKRAPLPVLAAILAGNTSTLAGTGNTTQDRLSFLSALERGVSAGITDVTALRAQYKAVMFNNLDPVHVLSMREREYGPRMRALLHQAIDRTADAGQRAQLLAMRLRLGRNKGDYLLSARSSEEQLAEITPSSDMLWFAGEAARGLYAVRRISEGRSWFELLRTMVAPGSHGDRTASLLWPLARLADNGAPPPPEPGRLQSWWEGQRSSYPPYEADRRVALLFATLNGLEEPLDGIDWQPLLAEPRRRAEAMPETAAWRSLAAASYEGRKGEAVLAALVAIPEASPGGDLGRVNPIVLQEALAALRRVGLEDEARAIAFDIALAAGF